MDNKRARFVNCIQGLGGYFDKELPEFLLEIYWNALKDYEIEEIEAGANKLIMTVKFFPKVVEWIEAITGGAGRLEDIAEIQANEVLKAVKGIGVYNSVLFDDPVTISVIQQCYGGWIKLCTDLLNEEEKWFRKDFVKYYRAYKRQNILGDGHLAGLIEFDNNEKFTDYVPEPVQIASIEKEKKLIAEGERGDEEHSKVRGRNDTAY